MRSFHSMCSSLGKAEPCGTSVFPYTRGMTVRIRKIHHDNEHAWRTLWRAYLAFYEHDLPAEQTNRTWNTLLADQGPYFGRVAELNGEIVGFAHFSRTVSTWEEYPDFYLEDLFVDTTVRGLGVGRALIDEVTRIACNQDASRVHWITKASNTTARKLYDDLATLSDFVIYERSTA